jgi:hypothetical protein
MCVSRFFVLFNFHYKMNLIFIAGRIGSGRFNQQQRTEEQGQRKREGCLSP